MPKVIGIKFKDNGKVFDFAPLDEFVEVGTRVVVETARGYELGIVATDVTFAEEDKIVQPLMPVVRVATNKDLAKAKELEGKKQDVINSTNNLINKYKLDMKVVDVEFTLDGQKVIINFVCEDRVDFRDLVKELAGVLKQRIELRQIGIRDQAKIVGGIGACGKEVCCKQFLNDFDKVSIKMAKTQGLSLNPTKISGVCGRLMCCLSYENEFYAEINAKMPKLNSLVKTKDGVGTVIYNNLLKSRVTVKYVNDNDIKITEYPLEEIEFVKGDKPQNTNSGNNNNTSDKNNNISDKKSNQMDVNNNKSDKNSKKFNKKDKNKKG